MTATSFFTIAAGIVAVFALAIYFFGIPPEYKRKLEKQALKTMGENKMSYMAKDQINKIPTSDQEDVKNLKKNIGNTLGGVVNNPIGETGGRVARRAWGSVSELSNNVLRRVSTYTQDTQAAAQQGADKIRVQVDEVKETRRHPKEQVD